MFRFALRDLFWATLVVAMGLGWWLHYREVNAHRKAFVLHAESLKETLIRAKTQNEQLKGNVDFLLKMRRSETPPDFSIWWNNVDWTVLDEPIP